MKTVCCFNDAGQTVEVPLESLAYRPAVYGILIENDRVLLLPHPMTGLWQLPGGMLEPGQGPGTALRHKFLARFGIVPHMGPLIHVESRHWVDSQGQAWHLSLLYYALKRSSTGVARLIDLEGIAGSKWLSLSGLSRAQMQFGFRAIHAAAARASS